MDTQLREVLLREEGHVSPSSYKILRRLGGGGFGDVYEAWDIRLSRRVALKQLKGGQSAQAPESLLAEARLAASVSHPAFVRIYAIDGDADAQAIVMELVDGVTLRQSIQESAHAEAPALEMVRQIAEAMAQAHAAGVAHGDLKTANLMLEPGGRVRILDFGLARWLDPLDTQTCSQDHEAGTLAYMAPERLQGQPPTPPADIYALGVILYELLAGRLPFAELNGFERAAAHLQSSPAVWPLPQQVSTATRELLRSMTAREPGLRATSMREVGEMLAAASTGRSSPPLRPRGAGVALRYGLAGLSIVLVLAGGYWWRSAPSDAAAVRAVAEMRAGMAALQWFNRPGNLDQAGRHFENILAHNPQHAGAAAGLSLTYLLRYSSDNDESWLVRAGAMARQALALDDQLALAHAASGWVLEMQGQMASALQAYERALALDPSDRFALGGKGNLLIKQRRYDAAGQLIDEARARYPNERMFSDLLGTLRFKQGDAVAAERAFRRSIELDPASTVSYANLNAALLYQNRGDAALQVLQQGLQVRPDSRLYGNLGAVLFARGDMAGAARAFEQALSADKGNPNHYLDWANLADALRWLPGREEESRQAYLHAADLLRPLLQRTADSPVLQSRMGLYAAKGGETAAARQAIAAALTAAGAGADTYFRAAVALEVLGERSQALMAVARSRALGYPANLIDSEPDLISLRRDRRYHLEAKELK